MKITYYKMSNYEMATGINKNQRREVELSHISEYFQINIHFYIFLET